MSPGAPSPDAGASAGPAARILLTNDDGWDSPGLAALAEVLQGVGELLVVAPREERSAIGHAITLNGTLEAEAVRFDGAAEAYAVDGTPADCAKLAIRALFADAPPAICVSGVNRGPNVGVNVFYSGTVGAALEAVVNGVPGVAVSKEHGDALSLGEAARLVEPLIREVLRREVLRRGMPAWHALNVNVPDRPLGEIRGVRVTRQGVSGFDEGYRELDRRDGPSRRRFQLEGEMRLREPDGMTDAEALAEGWVSVTPVALDLTARGSCGEPTGWEWLAAVPLEG
ncbi:MAG: 5'/3'-nucleotidase SurE [Planctomycetota bacterium]